MSIISHEYIRMKYNIIKNLFKYYLRTKKSTLQINMLYVFCIKQVPVSVDVSTNWKQPNITIITHYWYKYFHSSLTRA